MKCVIKGRYLEFVEYTPEEIAWVDKRLTWKLHPEKVKTIDENGNEKEETVTPIEKLLFKSGDKYWTYHGLYSILKDLWSENIELIEKEPEINYNRVFIDNNILPGIELFDFQTAAASKAIMLKSGLELIPTSGGKTEIILAVLRYLIDNNMIKRGVIVVPSVGLCEQLTERAYLRGFTKEEIGKVSGVHKEYDSRIIVAVSNSLDSGIKRNNTRVLQLLKEIDFLGFDEVHHLRASGWVNIVHYSVNAEYILGWSGSPLHSNDVLANSGDALIWGIMGRIIFTETYDHLREIGLISEAVVLMRNVPGKLAKYAASYNKVYAKYICENLTRNTMIVDYAKMFCDMNFSVLILVQKIEHATELMKSLLDYNPICVFGGSKGLRADLKGEIEQYKLDYNQFREQFKNGIYKIVIASQVMDEGMDIPGIGCIIMAGGGKSRIKLTQRLGRGLRRKHIGPNRVYVVDFNDLTHIFLNSHSRKRKDFYQESGAVITTDHYQFINAAYAHFLLIKEHLENESRLS